MGIFAVLAFFSAYGCERELSHSGPVEGKLVAGYELIGHFSEGKAAVRKSGAFSAFAYIDATGTILFEIGYDDVSPFSEGLAAVRKYDRNLKTDRYGFIDASGTLRIGLQFADAATFSEGLAAVRVGRLYGYIDQTGQMIIPPQFDRAFPFAGGLARIVIKGFCGFIDKTGKQVIEPRFFRAGCFSEGLVPLATKDLFGYADQTGNFVIAPQFDDAKEFKDGLAPVKIGKKWKYIDQSGQPLSTEEYDEARPFSEGLAVVGVIRTNFMDPRWGGYSGTKMAYGFIDKTGQYVIQPKFLGAESFSSGLSLVSVPQGDWFGEVEDAVFIDRSERQVGRRFLGAQSFINGMAFVKIDQNQSGFVDVTGKVLVRGKGSSLPHLSSTFRHGQKISYGFADQTGNLVIPQDFRRARSFSDGLAYVETIAKGKRQFIDKSGKAVIELSGTMIPQDFSEGLAAVQVWEKSRSGTLVGFIDPKGKFVIKPRFHAAKGFSEGLAPVKFTRDHNSNSWGFIDKNGTEVFPAKFLDATPFHGGLARVNYIVRSEKGLGEIHSAFIDKSGTIVVDPRKGDFYLLPIAGFHGLDESSFVFSESLFPVLARDRSPNNAGYIDASGRFAISPQYADAKAFSEGLAAVKTDSQWGYIDAKGNMVIAPALDKAGNFSDQRALVEVRGKQGFIDPAGRFIVEPQFCDEAGPYQEGLALIRMNGMYGFLDSEGRFVIEPQFDDARPFSEGLAAVGLWEE
ncbi:MAG: hypothetical protein CVV42_17440 [Candidatus Riflebacteria bacterium HGW-Riflebacteria-2]|jgi:hypothetical protein|nr:MAG: hypothetical protein CVV42_17440 [Candidatus Riflebacteria bacterium HGW-Riflebacteria-2]